MSNTAKPESIQLILNDKFKDVHFSIRYLSDNIEPQVTMRNLLAYLMIDRNEAYPTKQSMNLKTDDLFALSFDVKTGAYGTKHIMEMKFNTLSERYSKEPHLNEAFEFIRDCISRPLINEETLAEAKQNMRSNLLRLSDKPNTLAAVSAYALGARGESLSVFSQGRIDILETITVDLLKEYHQQLLSNDDVFIIGIGQIDPSYKEIMRSFVSKPKSFESSSYCVSEKPYLEEKISKKVKQTALVTLYATGKNNTDPNYMAYRLMSYLLGQLPNSLLFSEIREKRNLCYSIYSNLLHYDGVLSIHTGISKKNRDLVLELIEQQLDIVKTNSFSEILFQSAKSLLINNYIGIEDDVSSWMNLVFSAWLLNKDFKLQTILDEIEAVDRQSIVLAAKNLKKLCTFTVTGQE
jgi:predicted Zn-dependent peptidase